MKSRHSLACSLPLPSRLRLGHCDCRRSARACSGQPAGGGLLILEFKPAMDDLMTMLIQPRHIKLYYAGQQKNWTLAAFELNELVGALRRIGETIPKYRNFSVDATVGSIFAPKIQAMNAAIQSATRSNSLPPMAI